MQPINTDWCRAGKAEEAEGEGEEAEAESCAVRWERMVDKMAGCESGQEVRKT